LRTLVALFQFGSRKANTITASLAAISEDFAIYILSARTTNEGMATLQLMLEVLSIRQTAKNTVQTGINKKVANLI